MRHGRTRQRIFGTPDALRRSAERTGLTWDDEQRNALDRIAVAERGLYLWGTPGRGKTRLLDVLYESAPVDHKLRLHFHEFFDALHSAFVATGHSIDAAIDRIAGRAELLCFDEFHVHDVGDAMLIRRALLALFKRGTVLAVTSNYRPDELLPNPLFHEAFEPTIALLHAHLEVVELGGTHDHRRGADRTGGFASGRWVSPGADRQLAELGLQRPADDERTAVSPTGRSITARQTRDDRIWFDFDDLCAAPTTPRDYLALAARFPLWIIDNVPDPVDATPDALQRFANLVDVLSDRDVPAVFIAATDSGLAAGDRAPLDLARTASRLGQLRRLTE
ncbi:cell division protein ZapE [Rhodococcus sp. ABRD24]|uniref:cell division protein ZapE n=1 Tax=Rhodococcus sp. ABRD24 TaxID=2507582 RepID=UPI0013F16A8E|nr:cell division protein ZapE [Rhodococcus sp. ABRD24]